MIRIRLFAAARDAAGTAEFAVPAGTCSHVVAALVDGRPRRFAEVLALSSLVTDGRRLDPRSEDLIADGATVDVLPPFAGG